MQAKTFLCIVFILLLCYFIFQFFRTYGYGYEHELFTTASSYYKCPERPVLPDMEEIFQEYGIQQEGLQNWDLYLPCGYTFVEDELSTLLLPKNPPKTLQGDPKTLYIFGIRGCDQLVGKNNLWSTLQAEYGFEKASTIMPPTYNYEDPKDVALLQQTFSSDRIYILKKNIQRKEGLKLTQDRGEVMRGPEEGYVVAQAYIRDLYLINDYKVNLRIYLLILLRGSDIQFFLCKKGKCIYTNQKYNDDDLDFRSNITSYNLDMTIYQTNPRTLEDLKEYIEKDRPGAYAPFQHSMEENVRLICMALKNKFYQTTVATGTGSKEVSSIKTTTSDHVLIETPDIVNFQLFGIDVIMDNQLRPYILEVNKGPDMTGRDEEDRALKKEIQKHMLEKVGVIEDIHIMVRNIFYAI